MPFSDQPADARLWVYAASRPLSSTEQEALSRQLEDFLSGWASHGRTVEGAAEVRDERFVLLAAHLPGGGDVSGCGIDASVHVLDAFAEDAADLRWVAGLDVFYRDENEGVARASRPDFAAMAKAGDVDAATPVFDLSIETVADLRAGRFEHPAGQGWHAQAFALAPPTA